MLLPLFSKASTVTHHHWCHPACPTLWCKTSWFSPSKLGATWPPWISVKWRQTAKGRRMEATSGCLLIAFFTMMVTRLTGRAAPWPTPFFPAVGKWPETHTSMMKRSGAMEARISSRLLEWKCDRWRVSPSPSIFCFCTYSLVRSSDVLSGLLRWQQQHRPVHSCRARVWPCVRTVPFFLGPVHHEAVLPGRCGGRFQLQARSGRQAGHPAAVWWVMSCNGLILRLTSNCGHLVWCFYLKNGHSCCCLKIPIVLVLAVHLRHHIRVISTSK